MLSSKTYVAIPPGETIKELLENKKMSQKEFALRMDMSEKHISRLINGEVLLTYETARKIECVLGISAKFLNNLEAEYRQSIVLVNEENEMDLDIKLSKKYPYKQMVKLGWIDDSDDNIQRVINLRKFFEVINLSLLEDKVFTSHILCRKLQDTQKNNYALMAFTQKAKIEARNIDVEDVNIKKILTSLDEIKKYSNLKTNDSIKAVTTLLSKYGVALVCLDNLDGINVEGITFLDQKKIVIGLVLDKNKLENFWFNLYHELGHIVLGHIVKNEKIDKRQELAADEFARAYYMEKKKRTN